VKKLALFAALFLLAVLLPARQLVLVNYVSNEIGNMVMDKLIDYAQTDSWYPLAESEESGDICLFVKEFDLPGLSRKHQSIISITYTVVKEPFGDYAEFVPIDTSVSRTWYVGTDVFMFDLKNIDAALDDMIEQVDTQIYLFLSVYGNLDFAEYSEGPSGFLEENLKRYCQDVLDNSENLFRKKASDQKLSSKQKKDFARFLGFDPATYSVFLPHLELFYRIVEMDQSRVVIEADLAGPSATDSQPIYGIIDLESGSYEIAWEYWE